MVALRGKEIDAFLARPDPGRPIILLYGPDAGLVRERADALLASAVDDPTDPFSLVRVDGDELAAEPSRLVDEAMTIPLFGGRRAIRIRAGSRSFASGIDTLADSPLKDCRIVIEAGELRPESLQRGRLRLNEGLRYRQQTVSVDQKRSHQQAVSMSRRSAHCRRDRMRSVIQLAAPKPPSVTRLAQAAPCQE